MVGEILGQHLMKCTIKHSEIERQRQCASERERARERGRERRRKRAFFWCLLILKSNLSPSGSIILAWMDPSSQKPYKARSADPLANYGQSPTPKKSIQPKKQCQSPFHLSWEWPFMLCQVVLISITQHLIIPSAGVFEFVGSSFGPHRLHYSQSCQCSFQKRAWQTHAVACKADQLWLASQWCE